MSFCQLLKAFSPLRANRSSYKMAENTHGNMLFLTAFVKNITD